jgi:Zn-dependent protease
VDNDFLARLMIVGLIVYGTSLHEMGHSFAAYYFGDPTPGKHGRLTFNPIPHLDPLLTSTIMPIFFFMTGGAPIGLGVAPVDPLKMRRPLRDYALTALAGPMMNFLLAGVLIAILWIPGATLWKVELVGSTHYKLVPANWLTAVLPQAALWNLMLGCFNLLPIPPLDGYSIIRPFLPLDIRRAGDALRQNFMMALVIVMIVGSYLFGYIQGPLLEFFWKIMPPRSIANF